MPLKDLEDATRAFRKMQQRGDSPQVVVIGLQSSRKHSVHSKRSSRDASVAEELVVGDGVGGGLSRGGMAEVAGGGAVVRGCIFFQAFSPLLFEALAKKTTIAVVRQDQS